MIHSITFSPLLQLKFSLYQSAPTTTMKSIQGLHFGGSLQPRLEACAFNEAFIKPVAYRAHISEWPFPSGVSLNQSSSRWRFLALCLHCIAFKFFVVRAIFSIMDNKINFSKLSKKLQVSNAFLTCLVLESPKFSIITNSYSRAENRICFAFSLPMAEAKDRSFYLSNSGPKWMMSTTRLTLTRGYLRWFGKNRRPCFKTTILE